MTESTLIAIGAAYAVVGIGVAWIFFKSDDTPGSDDLPFIAFITVLCVVGWPIIGYNLIADAVKFR